MAKAKAVALPPDMLPDRPEPTARQKDRIAKARERVAGRPPAPRLRVLDQEASTATVCAPHTNDQGLAYHLMDTFGSGSRAFADHQFSMLGLVVNTDPNKLSELNTNAALAAVAGVAAENEAEAMLAVQLVATQSVAMEMLRRARFATELPHMVEYGNLATKLLRTYTAHSNASPNFAAVASRRSKWSTSMCMKADRPSSETSPTLAPGVEGVAQKQADKPMHLIRQASFMYQSPRCGARTRSGKPCRSPAVKDRKRCRMHGARAGAPEGERNGMWRHGMRSREHLEEMRAFRELLREAREALTVR